MCKTTELPPGKSVEKKILARRVAVFNDNGTLYGIEADCKHMKASLCTGNVENGIVTCKWHHWKYDLKSGECLNIKNVKLNKYDIELDGEDIYLILNF
jgi:nitrite reductase (NADH) small subunit/3-phenylpropionate/trans-cinnamate dioxygenase ferredoxin subunit